MSGTRGNRGGFLDVGDGSPSGLDRWLVNRVSDGVFRVDGDGRFAAVNDAFVELTGRSRDCLLADSVESVVGRGDADHLTDLDAERMLDVEVRTDDGVRPCTVRARPGPNGDTLAVVEADASETTSEADDRVRREDLQVEFDSVFDRVTDAVFALDDDWQFTYVNPRAEHLLERTAQDLVGVRLWSEFPTVEGSAFEEAFREAMDTQESVSFEEHFAPLECWFEFRVYPSQTGLSVYFRDVTERKTREQRLEKSRRLYQTMVDNFPNGVVTLFDEDLEYTIAGGDGLAALGVTSTEMEGRSVREVFDEALADQLVDEYEATLAGESRSFELEHGGETWQAYTVPVTDEAGEVFAGMSMAQNVTEQRAREHRLKRQTEQLEALNELNGLVREITDAAFEQSTREEIERIACEGLAETESYLFAWVGEPDPHSRTMDVRARAGVEEYPDEVTISMDPDDPRSEGPTGQAALTHEVQTIQRAQENPDYEPWQDAAAEYGFRSSAAIPIVHDDTLYGVLNVYDSRPDAFTGAEREVVRQLGEVLGHAIAAVERKHALMSDEQVELEFGIPNLDQSLGGVTEFDGSVTIEQAVPRGDDEFLVYGTATGGGLDTVERLVDTLDHWRGYDVISTDEDEARFALELVEPPVLSAVASLGGTVERATIEDGDYHMTVRLPRSGTVRHVIDAVQGAYPSAQVLARRQVVDARETPHPLGDAWGERLTDRQQSVLEAAYFAGYFNRPRDSSGSEIADSLGISAATFGQHLRVAQRKLFAALLDD